MVGTRQGSAMSLVPAPGPQGGKRLSNPNGPSAKSSAGRPSVWTEGFLPVVPGQGRWSPTAVLALLGSSGPRT
jgi:hypothetical protein